MPSNTEITAAQLIRLVGLPTAPVILDVRTEDDFAADPRLLPASLRRGHDSVRDWGPAFAGRQVVVVCRSGRKLSQGVAAFLRLAGAAAETLEGGFEAWREAAGPFVTAASLPPRDATGRTAWVTRARPKVDRIACPWLIRRFVDPDATFLFVSASEVEATAAAFGATAFDVEGAFFSHRGEGCTFDAMLETFGLKVPALDHLATIVRAADTARLDLSPQAAGFLAASLGLSRMYRDDLTQLDAGMGLYDAFYRWCRDAVEETHTWPSASQRQG